MNAVKNYQSLAPWADKECKTCYGKGRMRYVHGTNRVEAPCDCIGKRLRKLQAKISPFK